MPFLQEPRVLIANTKLLKASGARIPTPERPWSWEEFRQVTKELTGKGRYGIAWPLKEPVSVTLNLGLSGGGQLFHRDGDGKAVLRFEPGDGVVTGTIHDQVNTDRSAAAAPWAWAARTRCPGSSAAGTRCSRSGSPHRQQIIQQAPEGFDWTVLPMPGGAGGAVQG